MCGFRPRWETTSSSETADDVISSFDEVPAIVSELTG